MGELTYAFTEYPHHVIAASGSVDAWPLFLVLAYYVSAALVNRRLKRRKPTLRLPPKKPGG